MTDPENRIKVTEAAFEALAKGDSFIDRTGCIWSVEGPCSGGGVFVHHPDGGGKTNIHWSEGQIRSTLGRSSKILNHPDVRIAKISEIKVGS